MLQSKLDMLRVFLLLTFGFFPLACKPKVEKLNTRTNQVSNESVSNKTDDALKNIFPVVGLDQNGDPIASPAMSFTGNGKSVLAQVLVNATVDVEWDAPTLEQCTVLPQGWSGLKGKQTLNVAYEQTLTLSCSKGGQIFSKTLSFDIADSAKPTLSIKATAAGKSGSIIVPSSTQVTIAWEASNVDSCAVQPSAWSGLQGSKSLVVERSTAFILECTTRGVRSSSFAVVNVDPSGDMVQQVGDPDKYSTMELEINDSLLPVSVAYNSKVNLSWSSVNMKTCSLNPGGFTGTEGKGLSASLTASTIFILECVSKNNTTFYQVGLANVSAPLPPKVTLTVNGVVAPVTLQRTGTAQLAWTSESAETCKLMSLTKGQLAEGLQGTFQVTPLLSSDIYYVMCNGVGGARAAFAPVNIPITAPVIDLKANGQSAGLIINAGTAVSVVWKAENVDSCNLMPAKIDGLSGTFDAGKVNQSVVYSLECKGPLGTSTTSLPIVIQPQSLIGVALSANGGTGTINLDYGAELRLLWTSVNATSCSLTPASAVGTTGGLVIASMTQSTTYSLTCSAAGLADAKANLVVNVGAAKTPEVTFLANGRNGSVQLETTMNVNLTWETKYATSCSLNGQALVPHTVGSRLIEGITQDRDFVFVCTGPGGTTQQTITVKAAVLCGTPQSIIDAGGQYIFPERHETRNFINRTGKFTIIPETAHNAGAVGNTAASALVACRLKGYYSVAGIVGGRWKSPHDNTTGTFDESKKDFVVVNSRSNNNLIDGITCRGRVLDRCVTDTRWFLGR